MLEILKRFFFHRNKKMSILEKLKDLVIALESEGATEEKQEETQEVSEPSEPEMQKVPEPPIADEEELLEEELVEEEDVQELPDYLECSEEESLAVLEKIASLRDIKVVLGELTLNFEEKKAQLLSDFVSSKRQLLASVESLRLEYGIPQEGYQVQLPSSLSDRVSFTKKD